MYTGLHVKYVSFVSYFNKNLIFLDGFSKNPRISNFIKIRLVEVELSRANWRMNIETNVTKLMVALRNFANAPKNEGISIAHKQDRQ